MKRNFDNDTFITEISKDQISNVINIKLIIFLYVISRVPLINNGFGVDSDAWDLARSGLELYYDGSYIPSRLPGYPVVEFLFAPLVQFGWIATNSLSVLFGIVCIYVFYMILKDLDINQPLFLTAVLAFNPLFWIHTTNSMDYIFSITFVLIAWLSLQRRNITTGGLFFGLAIGARLVNGILGIPFLIYLWLLDENIEGMGEFFISSAIAGSITFLPLYLTHGFTFLTYYPNDISLVAKMTTIQVDFVKTFGYTVIIFPLATILSNKAQKNLHRRDPRVVFVLVSLAVTGIIYIYAPYETGYLLVLVPFVIALLGLLFTKWPATLLGILLVSSVIIPIPYLAISDSGVSPGKTSLSVMNYDHKAEQTLQRNQDLISSLSEIQENSVIIVGYQRRQMTTMLRLYCNSPYFDSPNSCDIQYSYSPDQTSPPNNSLVITYSLTNNQMSELEKDGYEIYYTTEGQITAEQDLSETNAEQI